MSFHNAMTGVGINVRALDVSGKAPGWIHLIPAGPVVGRDGREWVNDSPQLILAAFAARGVDLPLDLEHSTELKAPQGEPAPAVGWIKDLQARAGEIWGRVEWTEAGRNAVESKSYRYVSPVFVFERESKRVVSLTSAGLTNRPNLFLHALNKQEGDIDAVIEKALAEGKIAPSSVEYHRAQCAMEGGLERFEAYVNPKATIGGPGQVDGGQAGDKDRAWNAEELRIAELFGLTVEDLQKYGRSEDRGQALNADHQRIAELFGNTGAEYEVNHA